MVEIVLHGRFAAFHEGPIKVAAKNVFEAIEAISRQLPGFQPSPVTGKARVKVVGYETQDSLYVDLEENETIHVVPQLNGGKANNAMMQILVGVALIGASFIPGIGTFVAGIAMKVGTMLVLGGLSQLLAPQPENDKDEQVKNRYLGTPGNTVAIGTRIPILYGEDRAYGHYISFDINAQQFSGAATSSSQSK